MKKTTLLLISILFLTSFKPVKLIDNTKNISDPSINIELLNGNWTLVKKIASTSEKKYDYLRKVDYNDSKKSENILEKRQKECMFSSKLIIDSEKMTYLLVDFEEDCSDYSNEIELKWEPVSNETYNSLRFFDKYNSPNYELNVIEYNKKKLILSGNIIDEGNHYSPGFLVFKKDK